MKNDGRSDSEGERSGGLRDVSPMLIVIFNNFILLKVPINGI